MLPSSLKRVISPTAMLVIAVAAATLLNGVEAKLGSNGTSRLGPLLYIYAGVLGGVPVLCCLCICLCVCCRARGSRKNRELIEQQKNLNRNYPGGPPMQGGIPLQNVVYGGGVGGVTPGYGYDQPTTPHGQQYGGYGGAYGGQM